MKLIVFFIIVATHGVAAQDTILFNQEGQVTMKGFDSFYRVCNYDLLTARPDGDFNDYHSATDKIYASGSYRNGKRYGEFCLYNTDGDTIALILYDENAEIDTVTIYDLSGQQMLLKFRKTQNVYTFYEWFDSKSESIIKDGNGKLLFHSGNLKINGQIKNYNAHGIWKIETLQYFISEKFRNGIFISGKARQTFLNPFETGASNLMHFLVNPDYFENTEKLVVSDFYRKRDYPKLDSIFRPRWVPEPQTGQVFTVIELKARFPGGMQNLFDYIHSKIEYPEEARENSITGTVVVSFTVEPDGQVKNPQIMQGLGYGLDEVALKIVEEMPDWLPGQQRGKPVISTFKIPIIFE